MDAIPISQPPAPARARWRAFFQLQDSPARNPAMEGLRGYAVLLVVFLHTISNYQVYRQGIPIFAPEANSIRTMASVLPSRTDIVFMCLSKAHYAVDLFFLLSGFLITRIVVKAGDRFRYHAYLWQRFLRIYPAFLVTLAVCVACRCFWFGSLPLGRRMLAMNLLFLNGCPSVYGMTAYNYPTWSLFYEMVFYLTFPLFFLLWRRARDGDATTRYFCSCLALAVLLPATAYLPRACAFFFGALLGSQTDEDLRRAARRVPTGVVVALYLALVIIYALFHVHWPYYFPFFGVGASLLFLKACYDGGLLHRLFTALPLRWLGNISYSLYLIHSLAIDLVDRTVSARLGGVHPMVALPLVLAVSLPLAVLFAVVVYAAVEHWYFRKPAGARSRPAAAPPEVPLRRAA